MTDRELFIKALDALDWNLPVIQDYGDKEQLNIQHNAINALRERLAQKEQEPVAWSYWQSCLNDDGTQTAPWVHRLSKLKPSESIINKEVVPLYITPPQRKQQELRGEQIYQIAKMIAPLTIGFVDVPKWVIPFARAIEAAHGIKP